MMINNSLSIEASYKSMKQRSDSLAKLGQLSSGVSNNNNKTASLNQEGFEVLAFKTVGASEKWLSGESNKF